MYSEDKYPIVMGNDFAFKLSQFLLTYIECLEKISNQIRYESCSVYINHSFVFTLKSWIIISKLFLKII